MLVQALWRWPLSEEMAKNPSSSKSESAKDANVDLDASALKTPVASVRDRAEAAAANTLGKIYNPAVSVGRAAERPEINIKSSYRSDVIDEGPSMSNFGRSSNLN